MSYCRFSSDNFRCEVYVYAHCDGGYVTHVAGNRFIIPPIPEPPLSLIISRGGEFSREQRRVVYKRRIDAAIANITARIYIWLRKPHDWSLAMFPRRDIGLPCDAASFSDDTASACADRLENLRRIGYRVPQYAIDALRAEVE